MRIGTLVRSKWIAYNHFGIVIRHAEDDEGWTHWRVQWLEGECPLEYTIEDERDLEVLCE